MRFFIIVSCALLVGGCTTPRKTFKPPSDAKVKAATTDLNIKVARARETAAKAKKAAEEAKEIADRLVRRASTLRELLDKLAAQVPAEYQGPVREVSDNVDALIGENTELQVKLKELTAWNVQLQDSLISAEKARVTLQNAQDEYAGGAASLANDATNERNERIKVEKQLIQQRFLSWLWKLGGGLIVVLIGFLIFLWVTGRLVIGAGKIASKL